MLSGLYPVLGVPAVFWGVSLAFWGVPSCWGIPDSVLGDHLVLFGVFLGVSR